MHVRRFNHITYLFLHRFIVLPPFPLFLDQFTPKKQPQYLHSCIDLPPITPKMMYEFWFWEGVANNSPDYPLVLYLFWGKISTRDSNINGSNLKMKFA